MPSIVVKNAEGSTNRIVGIEVQPGIPLADTALEPGESSEPMEVEMPGHYNVFVVVEGAMRPLTRHVYLAEKDKVVETFLVA